MQLHYRISMWNYCHYTYPESLEWAIGEAVAHGFGVELWEFWQQERDLYTPANRPRLRAALNDIPSSLHGGLVHDLAGHQMQIDCASETGSDVVVVHPDHLQDRRGGGPDLPLLRDVVQYAAERGVTIALENGPLWFLAQALEAVEGLRICLDVGHPSWDEAWPGQGPAPLADYLRAFRPRLAHLHLQDRLETDDHYILGTGLIPRADWEMLLEALEEDNFQGAAVLEIRPRLVLPSAQKSVEFLKKFGVGPAGITANP